MIVTAPGALLLIVAVADSPRFKLTAFLSSVTGGAGGAAGAGVASGAGFDTATWTGRTWPMGSICNSSDPGRAAGVALIVRIAFSFMGTLDLSRLASIPGSL